MKRILLHTEPNAPHSTVTTTPVTPEVAKAALVLHVIVIDSPYALPPTLQNADRSLATSSR
jgi:hypothetical protein